VTRALSVAALAGSVLLAVFAGDILRWRDDLEAHDVRFLAAPAQVRYAAPDTRIPRGAAELALGAGDDVAFRRRLESFARIRPGTVFTPQLLALRAETQLGLADLARRDGAAARRSRAANMMGVLALDESLAPRDAAALANLIAGAIGSFRNGVELDPGNADAKTNLELALRIARASTLSGDAPEGGRNEGDEAGVGQPGSGY
jgi:hypothetical protein